MANIYPKFKLFPYYLKVSGAEKPKTGVIKYRIYTLSIIILQLVSTLPMIGKVLASALKKEFGTTIETYLFVQLVVMLHVKIASMLYNGDKVNKIMEKFSEPPFYAKSDYQTKIIQRGNDLVALIEKIFLSRCSATGLCLLVKALVSGTLPFEIVLPFAFDYTPMFEITFTVLYIGFIYNVIFNIATDPFFVGCMVHIGIQCDCLCDTLKNLYENCRDRVQKLGIHEDEVFKRRVLKSELKRAFHQCIIHHQNIIWIANQVVDVITVPLFYQFTSSMLIFATNLYQLREAEIGSIKFMTFTVLVSGLICELFLYMWLGNLMTFKSSLIPDAAFNTNLVVNSQGLKGELTIFLQRSNIPILFKAGGIIEICNDTSIKILKSAVSFMAVLNQLDEKGK